MNLKTSSPLAVLAFLLLTLGLSAHVGAQETGAGEVPKILLSGLEAYKAEGPEAAVKAWIKGSAVEGSREALSQANLLRQIQDFYGAYKEYHVICSRKVTPTTRVFFLSLDFEKGPLFGRFVVYRTEQGWILTQFNFNTKDEAIVPTTC